MNRKSIHKVYLKYLDQYSTKFKNLKKFSNWLAFMRLIFFILLIFTIVLDFKFNFRLLNIGVTVFAFILFIFIVKKSIKISGLLKFYNNLVIINEKEIKALDHNFKDFDGGSEFTDPSLPYSYDLDLFGNNSIFSQINRTTSVNGKKKLAEWFMHITKDKDIIYARQEAVKEISKQIELRQNFIALVNHNFNDDSLRKNILNWINQTLSTTIINFFKYVSIIFSAISVLTIILSLLSIISSDILLAILVINGIMIFSKIKIINEEYILVSKQYQGIMQYADQIGIIEKNVFNSEQLSNLKKSIGGNNQSGSKALKELAKIINNFDYRLNMFVAIILNGFFYWDFICVLRLHKWKVKYHDQIADWFETLDEFDAIQSIGNFCFNNSGFIFPEISDKTIISGKKLGHPQIKSDQRVCNDFVIEKKGVFHIITGPNMAGKSTFLRTIGYALVMAQAGAPVCAEQFSFKPLNLYTSMRTTDSLDKNESYFLAEILRLKSIINAIKENNDIFIILDEILKGTNSKDQAEGSKQFLRSISEMNANGVVATHDISLGILEKEYPENIVNYCFEADNKDDKLFYDYRIRKGITSKMNASVLMKQMGII